ncbi:hypothetical protein VTH82DRAFT_3975 [Thermothelomyces myriococcoides]
MQQETEPHTDPPPYNADTIQAAPPSTDASRNEKGPGVANYSTGPAFAPPVDTTNAAVQGEPEEHPPMAPQPPYVGVVPINQLTGEQPQWIICPFCQRQTTTRVSKEGTIGQILGGVLCCLCCVLLTPLPCLCGWCEELNYYCSSCNAKLATRPDKEGPLMVLAPAANNQPQRQPGAAP